MGHGLPGVELCSGDIRDRTFLAEAVAGVEFVVHTAALTQLVPRPRRTIFEINVEGTRNLCEAALAAGVRRFVITSSVATFVPGTAAAPACESSRPRNHHPPYSPYYDSKQEAEQVTMEFNGRGLQTLSLCPAYIIGPGDYRPTTNALILYAARHRFLLLPPGGINFIDVREAAAAHARALWAGDPGRRYVLAGPFRRYTELARVAQSLLGKSPMAMPLPHWTKVPGSAILAIAAGCLRQVPNAFSVPALQSGFQEFHMSGRVADAAFHLRHRQIEETVRDTLAWFRKAGML